MDGRRGCFSIVVDFLNFEIRFSEVELEQEMHRGAKNHYLLPGPYGNPSIFSDGPDIWMFPKIVVPPNHPILIGFSIITHPFWGIPIFGNTHI